MYSMTPAYQELTRELAGFIPAERLLTAELDRLAQGTDASFYRLVPQLVVRVCNDDEVQQVLRSCARRGLPVTFRAAGTSLSGQAVTDSVLIQLGNGWNGHQLLDNGAAIRLQPGIIGARANSLLAPLGRKIGPDPASINACMIGGIAANNASGMCCGTAENSYNTLLDLRLILADGTLLDTADAASVTAFRTSHAGLLQHLAELGAATRANTALAERIRHKYRLKNTTGYSINALVDFSDPLDILKHLMIGSEGTLGFISAITYRTVPDYPDKAAALIYFPDIHTACTATLRLKETPVSAVELLDRASLRSVQHMPGLPAGLADLPDGTTALLVDVRGENDAALHANIEQILHALQGIPVLQDIEFTHDPHTYDSYWNVRKGTFPAVGANRVVGTTVIIEDVAFPLDRLAEGVLDLQALLQRHGYHEAILFGHALEGNLHFVFTQSFNDPAEVSRYAAFMDALAQLVAVEYGGSLKAEHGTGRNMAPYVELEWGSDAYALMKRIKQLFDPSNLLNPGVLISDNPTTHVENLKPLPKAHGIIDACIECGFCEAVCPSRRLTLSPRQRIVIWRELERRRQSGADSASIRPLEQDWQYSGLDTCAVDGLCGTRCPVNINTGDLVRDLRSRHNTRLQARAGRLAQRFSRTTAMARSGLRLASLARTLLGDRGMRASMQLARKAGLPVGHWRPGLPAAAPALPAQRHFPAGAPSATRSADKVIYWPSCVSRVLGSDRRTDDSRPLFEVTLGILHKAGYEVLIPDNINELCCGLPFQSKGLFSVADSKRDEMTASVRQLTGEGSDIPVISDTSPCNLRMREGETGLNFYEAADFMARHALPRLQLQPLDDTIALHPTCSTQVGGNQHSLLKLARACAREVVVPASVSCCGFAGDRGFQVPELNASALQDLRDEVTGCSAGYSNSRTCEIGLSEHSGLQYRSILYLLDRVSQPLQTPQDNIQAQVPRHNSGRG